MTSGNRGREIAQGEVDTSGQGAGEWVTSRVDDLERMARDGEAQVESSEAGGKDENTSPGKFDDLAQERVDDAQRKVDQGTT